MDPSVGLQAASGLVNFLLKTTLEWSVCLLLVRIAGSPRTRFNLWLGMLLTFLAQWIWMGIGIVRALFPATAQYGAAKATALPPTAERIAVGASLAGTVSRVLAGLFLCYLAMVAWRIFGTLAARVRLARAMRFKSAPEAPIASAFQESLEQTASRECELWVLPGLASPATLGWLKPRIIVPPVCQTQDPAELKAVFWHELKHVGRRDALWSGIVRTCRNLLWFHPCVHHAVAALNAQRELACDAAVVEEHPHSRDVYATCLVRFARMVDLAPESAFPAIEMASSTTLLTLRVHSILSDAPRASRVLRVSRATANILLVALMAATVPGLNILFAAQQATLPLPSASATEVHAVASGRPFKSVNASVERITALPSRNTAQPSAAPSIGLQHDDLLAAEHRAAMGILTESTGMDDPASASDGRLATGATTAGQSHGTAARPSPSWTSVAIDAAQHIGPLGGEHSDHDDHH